MSATVAVGDRIALDRRYDPRYDPLVDPSPGVGRDYAPTWWVASAGTPPGDDGAISADLDCDVAIVGSGSTGISTALYLAQEHGVRAVVLEANRASWGCSSRSGGQGQNASGRLKRSQWIERWGLDVAKALDAEIRAGFENFAALTREIDCDADPSGHWYVAHRPDRVPVLARECALMRDTFGYDTRMVTAEELRREVCDEREAAGALYEREGIGIHPLKLTFGLIRRARSLGVRIHPASPVQRWTQGSGGIQELHTPGGVVRARRVAICTGGYTSNALSPVVRDRLMPILSNSLVTRPLTDAELAATGFRSEAFLTDTRVLRFYYRLLRDGDRRRLQIGSRSSITGAEAENPVHLELLTDAIARKFPPLAGIEVANSWWGWVDVSHDMMPRIARPDPARPVWYALGYGGNGVSFSTWAGKRLAERVVGKDAGRDVFKLPIYDSPLEFPNVMGVVRSQAFAPFRRLGQRMLYRWYWLRDEKL
jgi:glycine/D-amino acid oxidase-like deaminating enzyme